MTINVSPDHTGSADNALLASLPEELVLPDARALIRAAHLQSGRRIAVLDDDPTGSQTVNGVSVVFVLDANEYAHGLAESGSTCVILTNSRSLLEPDGLGRGASPRASSAAATPRCAATRSPRCGLLTRPAGR